MKREFITGLLPDIDKAVLDQIMDEHGKGIVAKNNTIAALTTERDGLQTQLNTANDTIKSYKDMDIDGIKTAAKEWEAKYNTDTQTLKDQLADAHYGFAVNGAVSALKFSSGSAKKAFVADLNAKKLPLQDGKLLGMEDFVKSYQTSDPDAFLPENDDKTPVATKGGTGGGNAIADDAALRAAFSLPDNSKKE